VACTIGQADAIAAEFSGEFLLRPTPAGTTGH
jgi:hypothetical protein